MPQVVIVVGRAVVAIEIVSDGDSVPELSVEVKVTTLLSE
jgi:hypothetical protein